MVKQLKLNILMVVRNVREIKKDKRFTNESNDSLEMFLFFSLLKTHFFLNKNENSQLRPDQTLDEMRSKVILELEDSKRCFEMRLSGNQMQNVAESSEKKVFDFFFLM